MFGSSEAARQLGGAINESFGWPVDLKNFDVEVILNIANSECLTVYPLILSYLFTYLFFIYSSYLILFTILSKLKREQPSRGKFSKSIVISGVIVFYPLYIKTEGTLRAQTFVAESVLIS